jgi:hypothetical protein
MRERSGMPNFRLLQEDSQRQKEETQGSNPTCANHSLLCSSGDKIRNAGPARLPSPIFTSFLLSGKRSRHFCLNAAEARCSKQSAMYRPSTGRNLKALFSISHVINSKSKQNLLSSSTRRKEETFQCWMMVNDKVSLRSICVPTQSKTRPRVICKFGKELSKAISQSLICFLG